MPETVDNSFDRRANHLLRLIQLCGGCVPLHRLQFQFSAKVIQTLLDKELVQVQNTGRGFLLEIAEDF
ncbi:hypothetical protein [Nostoc sphaeroides]|uniref:Uncharacterized protein n=1 Tax=Nostoc sphaeroides CCNUC1 TaxID=2653204 RepID=A0A5P8WI80_9NOSO|nr:hypothetical protein [Nostoc sphaeroides]QFS52291.1 hypothetical protein GXM_09785 [Nostoc sphaeroides CCNUC1]